MVSPGDSISPDTTLSLAEGVYKVRGFTEAIEGGLTMRSRGRDLPLMNLYAERVELLAAYR